MVGVAGRSKACHNCRRRRIGCSQTRPQCIQCKRGGHQCEGYEKDRIFVPYKYAAAEQVSTGPQKDSSVNQHSPTLTQFGSALDVRRLAEPCPASVNRAQAYSSILPLCSPLVSSFVTFDYVLLSILSTPHKDLSAFEQATLAVCLAKIGRLSGDRRTTNQSFEAYFQGIRALRSAIESPNEALQDETLAACAALLLYETIECPQNSASSYQTHLEGCAKLMQLRGPARSREGIGHAIFPVHKLQYALRNICLLGPSYLSDPAWVAIPWDLHCKQPFEQLLDLLESATPILQEARLLRKLPREALIESTRNMIESCWQIDRSLEEIQIQLEQIELPCLIYREQRESYNGKTIRPIDSKMFRFSEIHHARAMISCWSIQAMLWSGMARLYGVLARIFKDDLDSSSTSHLLELPPLEHRADWKCLARNACRAVSYCLEEWSLTTAAWTLAAPLGFLAPVVKNSKETEEESRWIEMVVSKLGHEELRVLLFKGGRAWNHPGPPLVSPA